MTANIENILPKSSGRQSFDIIDLATTPIVPFSISMAGAERIQIEKHGSLKCPIELTQINHDIVVSKCIHKRSAELAYTGNESDYRISKLQ